MYEITTPITLFRATWKEIADHPDPLKNYPGGRAEARRVIEAVKRLLFIHNTMFPGNANTVQGKYGELTLNLSLDDAYVLSAIIRNIDSQDIINE